jgi:phosphoribosylformylglycinamidine synthase
MMSWSPARWGQADTGGPYTPWMRFFQNARRHLG